MRNYNKLMQSGVSCRTRAKAGGNLVQRTPSPHDHPLLEPQWCQMQWMQLFIYVNGNDILHWVCAVHDVADDVRVATIATHAAASW